MAEPMEELVVMVEEELVERTGCCCIFMAGNGILEKKDKAG